MHRSYSLHTFILLIGLLLTGPLSAAPVVELNRIVAVVNDGVITELELAKRLEREKRQLAQRFDRLPDDTVLRKQILELMLMERLQLERARQIGLRIGDEQLNRTIANIARQSGMNLDEYRAVMERDGIPFGELREDIREELLIGQLRQRDVYARVQIGNEELQHYLQTEAAKGAEQLEYLLSHILISVPEAASPEQVADAKNRAEALLGRLRAGERFAELAVSHSDGAQALEGGNLGWRQAAQLPSIFSDVVPQMAPGEISELLRSPSGFHILKLEDKRGQQQHLIREIHARHILIAPNAIVSEEDAQRRIQRLARQLREGADFAELARSHSDDPGSASKGGDLGWADPEIYVPAFREALDKLKVNETGQPFRSRFGWHIVQLLGERQQDNSELLREKQARKALQDRKAEEKLQEWLRKLRDEAYVEIRLDG